MNIFVSVGNANQSFDRLLNEINKIANTTNYNFFIQTGNSNWNNDNIPSIKFMELIDFENRIIESDILILHAGAGSLLTAIKHGKYPILVPRLKLYKEHVDDHQSEFANSIENNGVALVVYDIEMLYSSILEINNLKKKNNKRIPSLLISEIESLLLNLSK